MKEMWRVLVWETTGGSCPSVACISDGEDLPHHPVVGLSFSLEVYPRRNAAGVPQELMFHRKSISVWVLQTS